VRKSTLSDAFQRFDPQTLAPLMEHVMEQVPHLRQVEAGQLEQVCQRILAAAGTMWNIPAAVFWDLHHHSHGKNRGPVRINRHLDIRCITPSDLSVSGKAQGSDAEAFIKKLHGGVINLVDRNFVHIGLINAVLERSSAVVVRLRDSDGFAEQEHGPLSDGDVGAWVLSDSMGGLPCSRHKQGAIRTTAPPDRPLRLVVCRDPETGQSIRILSSLLDLPAYVIAEL